MRGSKQKWEPLWTPPVAEGNRLQQRWAVSDLSFKLLLSKWRQILRKYFISNKSRVLIPVLLLLLAMLGAGAAAQANKAQEQTPVEVKGDFIQGGIIFGRAQSDEQVWVGEKRLRLTDEGDFVFGLDRDQASPVTITIVDAQGRSTPLQFDVVQREYNVQKIEGVAQKHVSPPPQVLKRIADEAAKVRQARSLDDDRRDFLRSFIWPLEGPITGVYGSQRVYNGTPKSPHYGIDIAGPVGAAVKAPAPGLITLAEPDLYFSGGTLIVDHGHGLSSTFIHLSKLLVQVGQVVEQGQVIAEVGATGRVTGPHLDWRMNWFDVRVDPQLLMDDESEASN